MAYGGRDEASIFSDLFIFDAETNLWLQAHNDSLKQRFGHSAVSRRNQVYFFGGWNGQETLNDIQCLEFSSQGQVTISTLGGCKGEIKGRYRHTASCNDTAMYIHGGID